MSLFRQLVLRARNEATSRAVQPVARMESLEDRTLFATHIWDGGSLLNDKWTEAKNWVNDSAPRAGDDLIFPNGVGALDRSTNNDFAAGTKFRSISIQGGGYTMKGNRVALGAIGLSAGAGSTAPTTANAIKFDLTIDSPTPMTVSGSAPALVIEGDIDGPGSLTKSGAGKLVFGGKGFNSYDGTTTALEGTLESGRVRDSDGFVAFGIPEELIVGNGTATANPAKVVLTTADQLRSFSKVTIDGGRLQINGFEHFSRLSMKGGEVTGTGVLVIGDQIIGGTFVTSAPAAGVASAKIATRELQLFAAVNANAPLSIESRIDKGGVHKIGPSSLALRGPERNAFQSLLRLDAGDLILGKTPGQFAFAGDLVALPGTRIILEASDQVRDTSKIQLNQGAVLNLGAFSDKIGPLDFGGVVTTSANGVVTLLSDVHTGNSPTATLAGRVDLGGAPRTFDVQGSDLTISATISGNQSLIKQGKAKLFLTGTSNFSGNTVLNEGAMVITGQQFNSKVVINGGTFSGTGRIGDLGAGAGFVSPGPSAGSIAGAGIGTGTGIGLLQTRSLNLLGTNVLRIEMNGTTAGTQFDQIRTTTNDPTGLLLGGTLDVRLANNFAPAVGTSFKIIDNFGSARVFDGVFFCDTTGKVLDHDGAGFVAGGQNFVINYHGGDGNDVVITRDSAPAFANRSVTNKIRAGELATLSGHITEPDAKDTFFLDVDWGDGSRPQTLVFPPGSSRDVDVTHRYAKKGAHKIHIVWHDDHGGSNSADLIVKVKKAKK